MQPTEALGGQMMKRRMELMAPQAKQPAKGMLIAAGALLAGLWLVRRRA